MGNKGEKLRTFVKRELREHPVHLLATLAVSAKGISLATHYFEETWHEAKDNFHDWRERRMGQIATEDTVQAERSEEMCDA